MTAPTGGETLVRTLAVNGVDLVFCVPGESFLAALDAFFDVPAIRIVCARHEAGAGNMAEAYGKLTGRPGIAFVTRGPGATHAAIAVHTARHDSTPLVLFVGQVARDVRGRDAFQEVDYAQMYGGLAKAVIEIDAAARIPELVTRALRTARSGRPGPVVVVLPEDVLRERAEAPLLAPATTAVAAPSAAHLGHLRDELAAAQRPLLLLGGGGWSDDACTAIARFAAREHLATACSFRRQALFDHRDARYIGDVGLGISPALERRLAAADVLIVLGGRLGDVPSGGYERFRAPRAHQRLVHVHADPDELGRVFEPDVAINAGPAETALALEAHVHADGRRWAAWTAAARADYEASLVPDRDGGAVDLARIVRWLSSRLPEDAIVTNGAGNFAAWLHRFFQYKRPRTQLAPTSGAMGYGVPAAVAAKLVHPERIVVAFSGDGDFSMSGHELATAVQAGANIIIVVVNNGMYGTIRMHQEREYPARPIATALRNPDFVALARAYGAFGALVETTDAFAPAFEAALASNAPAVLELRTDPEIISPRATITSLREVSARATAGARAR